MTFLLGRASDELWFGQNDAALSVAADSGETSSPQLHLGLDLLFLLPESAGLEVYVRELLPAMFARQPNLKLTAFVNRDAYMELDWKLDSTIRVVHVQGGDIRNRYKWAVKELALLPLAAERAKVDLLHSLGNFAPLHGRFRRVVTIFEHPSFHMESKHITWPVRACTAAMVQLGGRRADRVITSSQNIRRELMKSGIGSHSIDVIPLGVRPPQPEKAALSTVRQRLNLGQRPVVLTVGTNLPHKNLATLIGSIARISPQIRPLFVLAGRDTDNHELSQLAWREGVSEDVRLLGRVSDDELEALYALARAVVLPTLHEAFGLPTIEAMMRSVPVACSDIPTMREVAGDAALYFNPHRAEEIAACAERITGDATEADHLRQAGYDRSLRFTWQAAADGTLASYSRAMAPRKYGAASGAL
jgi:glycosyltransferase involved in cell wall biosynthesis